MQLGHTKSIRIEPKAINVNESCQHDPDHYQEGELTVLSVVVGYEPDTVAFNRDGESAEEDETYYQAYPFEPVHWLGTVMPYLGRSVITDAMQDPAAFAIKGATAPIRRIF
jgi:hypothetical protein